MDNHILISLCAVNNSELTLEVPEYWRNLMYDNQRFYFKAGLYFSGKNVDKKAIVEYKSLFIKIYKRKLRCIS